MADTFKIEVSPGHVREDLIAKQLATPSGVPDETYDVFPGNKTELPKIRLPIGLPVYRMANGRTSIEQIEFIKVANIKDTGFFAKGEEREDAQTAQHEILAKLAREGSESVSVIMKELRDNTQTAPIWITSKGVVINGNRRLAAMRELYAEDSSKYGRYATVECAVLPSLTPDQIEELEIRLQVAPDFKLPYGWIHDCLLIEKRLRTKKGEKYVADLLRRKPSDVKAAISALSEVNIYLKDWKNAAGDYGLVEEDGKQFFYDLPKHLKNKSGVLLEATRRIGWILYDAGDLGTRLYAYNKIIGEKSADVLNRLASRDDVLVDDEDADTGGVTESEDLDVDLGEDTSAPDTDHKVLNALNDQGRREEVAAAVIAVCTTMYEAGKTNEQSQSALRTLREIQTRLIEIDLTKAAPDTHPGIAKQLQEISRIAKELEERNAKYLDGRTKHETQGT